MVSSKNKQWAIIILAVFGMIVDVLLRQSYEQSLLIHMLQNCSSGCNAKDIVSLPVFFGIHFAQWQWIFFGIQFSVALLLLQQHTTLLNKIQEYVIIVHALPLGILLLFSRYQFTGSWLFVIITSIIVLLILLIVKSKSLYTLKMKKTI